MDAATAMQWVQTVGFPIAVAASLGYAVYKAMVWIALEVLKPIAIQHITLMQTLQDELKKQTNNGFTLNDTMIRNGALAQAAVEKNSELTEQNGTILSDQNKKLDQLAADIRGICKGRI